MMFLIMFLGFGLMAAAAYFDLGAVLKVVLMSAGVILSLVLSSVFGIKKVRCPHCNALLSLKLTHTYKCPFCNENIND